MATSNCNNSESQIEQSFKYAVESIQSLPKDCNFQPSQEMMLRFYALYKQANCGQCTGPRPGFWDLVGRAKCDAWCSLGTMSRLEAMENYIEELKKIVEVMPQTDAVGNFTRSLGRFYEIYVEKPPETVEKVASSTTNKSSPTRTPSPIHSNNESPKVVPSVGSNEEPGSRSASESSSEEGEDEKLSEDDDQFADTFDIQPEQSALLQISATVGHVSNGNNQNLNTVLSAIERLQTEVTSLNSRLSNVEHSLGELLVHSRRETHGQLSNSEPLWIFIFKTFRNKIPSRFRSLILFLLPIIAGFLLARRFIFLRRR